MGRAGTGCSREHGRNGEIDSAIAEKLSGARTTPVWGRNPGDRKERRKKVADCVFPVPRQLYAGQSKRRIQPCTPTRLHARRRVSLGAHQGGVQLARAGWLEWISFDDPHTGRGIGLSRRWWVGSAGEAAPVVKEAGRSPPLWPG